MPQPPHEDVADEVLVGPCRASRRRRAARPRRRRRSRSRSSRRCASERMLARCGALEDGARVRVEGEHDGLAAEAVRHGAQVLDDVAVAAVHPVEDADRDDGAAERRRDERRRARRSAASGRRLRRPERVEALPELLERPARASCRDAGVMRSTNTLPVEVVELVEEDAGDEVLEDASRARGSRGRGSGPGCCGARRRRRRCRGRRGTPPPRPPRPRRRGSRG